MNNILSISILLISIILFLIFIILGCYLIFKNNKKFQLTNNKNKVELSNKKKARGVVCFFGVIPRSIKYTYQSIKEHILDVLAKDFEIDIYIFNLDVENTLVDGVKLSQNDIDIIPFTFKEEYKQTYLDHDIDILCNEIECKWRDDYGEQTSRNAIRQMYSEYRVGLFLDKHKHKYKFSLICGPDFYFANNINLNHLNDSIKSNYIYTSQVNDAEGYTNGFYFGKLELLIPLLKRYENIRNYLPSDHDYEFFVKKALDDNNIKREKTDIVFFKIRANKFVVWQGEDRSYIKNIDDINTKFDKLKYELSNFF